MSEPSTLIVESGIKLRFQSGLTWSEETLARAQVMFGPFIETPKFCVLTFNGTACIVPTDSFQETVVEDSVEVIYLTGVGFLNGSTKESFARELDRLHRITLPSLVAQTNQSFRWIIAVNTDLLPDPSAALPINPTGLGGNVNVVAAFEGDYQLKSEQWGNLIDEICCFDEGKSIRIATATLPVGAAINARYTEQIWKFLSEMQLQHGVLEYTGGIGIEDGKTETARYVHVANKNPLTVLVETYARGSNPITAAHPDRDSMTNKKCRIFNHVKTKAAWLYVMDRAPVSGDIVGDFPYSAFGLTEDSAWPKR